MSSKTENMFFVLREGSTQEEQWSWEAIEDMSRDGDLSALGTHGVLFYTLDTDPHPKIYSSLDLISRHTAMLLACLELLQ